MYPSRCKYVNFNVIKCIKSERLTKLNKNLFKKIALIFISIDFYIKWYRGLFVQITENTSHMHAHTCSFLHNSSIWFTQDLLSENQTCYLEVNGLLD